jgi:hypothetical protein
MVNSAEVRASDTGCCCCSSNLQREQRCSSAIVRPKMQKTRPMCLAKQVAWHHIGVQAGQLRCPLHYASDAYLVDIAYMLPLQSMSRTGYNSLCCLCTPALLAAAATNCQICVSSASHEYQTQQAEPRHIISHAACAGSNQHAAHSQKDSTAYQLE